MYSPTTRMLAVLELLQSYGEMSGAELARRLYVNIRTVRRYIVMLQDMGIPVEAERGPYGAYQLQRGYKLPPLMYTDEEAVALTLALLAIREYRFPVDVAAVESALAKTERVMPELLLNQARGLQEAITFKIAPTPALRRNDFVVILSSAVRQRQRVWLRYESYEGEASEREFDPYGIVFNEGIWYTAGYCHLRQDLRTFRLDRVRGLERVSEAQAFERPAGFDALAHVMRSLTSWQGKQQVEVLLHTTMDAAQEFFPPEMGTLEATPEGIIFRRPVAELEWTAHVLLHVPFTAKIVQPEELRELVRTMGLRALALVGDEEK